MGMLVLTREVNQDVLINPGQPDEILIRILRNSQGKIRIGFIAPRHINIVRGEVVRPATEQPQTS